MKSMHHEEYFSDLWFHFTSGPGLFQHLQLNGKVLVARRQQVRWLEEGQLAVGEWIEYVLINE